MDVLVGLPKTDELMTANQRNRALKALIVGASDATLALAPLQPEGPVRSSRAKACRGRRYSRRLRAKKREGDDGHPVRPAVRTRPGVEHDLVEDSIPDPALEPVEVSDVAVIDR